MSIFSKIAAGEIPSYKCAESDKFYAFLDINPVALGHTLVIPRQETDYIFDLDDELLAEYQVFAKRVARAIQTVLPCSHPSHSLERRRRYGFPQTQIGSCTRKNGRDCRSHLCCFPTSLTRVPHSTVLSATLMRKRGYNLYIF